MATTTIGLRTPLRARQHARSATPRDARSFAAYMQDRPAPLDGIERTLLRLDWLCWRRTRAGRG